jgi:chemotaxis protein MotB
MKLRRRQSAQVSHERWLVSYADFVTLLFAFFVVLYATAQIDKRRALQLSDAIQSGFQEMGVLDIKPGGLSSAPGTAETSTGSTGLQSANASNSPAAPGYDLDRIQYELERALAAEIKRKEVALHMTGDGLVLSLREMGFFDSGSAAIKPDAEAAIARIAGILRDHHCLTRIEGHTDNMPIHTAQFASNWELSTARATGMVRALVEKYGIAPSLLSAAGYAEFRPAAPNDTNEGRQLNRRVDLIMLKSDHGFGMAPSAATSAATSPAQSDSHSPPSADTNNAKDTNSAEAGPALPPLGVQR